ncbi:MAG: hypothetical protein A2Z31_10505 [candidate division NC10 bacterium RBG_16_65_8]|nr:MAG: hypothetical protein A2Z31_10505 [candidate division NC10 bacterium RBG_16_65_8]
MSEPEDYAKAFLPITQRIRAAFATILDEERERAFQEGLPGNVFFEGTLNTLLWIAARIACPVMFPGEDPDSPEGRARVFRVQRAVSQAFVIVMAHEKEGAVGPDAPSWPDQQEGHA